MDVISGSTSTTPDTSNSITQTGGATSTTSAPDLENPAGIKESGTATTSEDLSLSGNYGGAACTNSNTEALFTQHAAVGIDGVDVVGQTNYPGTYGNPDTDQASSNWPATTGSQAGSGTWTAPYWGSPYENPFSAAVECAGPNLSGYLGTGSYWVEADLGQSTTAGYEQIQAEGALPTMSGSSSAYAGFSGAYNTNAGQMPEIETMVAGSTGFGMFNNWGFNWYLHGHKCIKSKSID